MVKFLLLTDRYFATVLALIIVVGGFGHPQYITDRPVSGDHAAYRTGIRRLSRGGRTDGSANRRFTDRATGKRRGRYALHEFKLLQFGAYSLTITFAVGTDIDMATVMVQNRVSIAQSSLPEPVIVQGITTRKQSSNIVMMLTLSSKDSIYDGCI